MDWISRSREFLDLDIYREQLKEYYRTIPLRSYLRDYFEFTLSRENLLWPIDRPGEYGIDIAVNGRRNKIHTWFSGIAGYMAAFKEYAANSNHPGLFDQFWHNSQTKLVHFLGYDCAFSHGIVYPSLLRNVDGLTKNVYLFPNKFLKLEGQDFSTSRGIAIWMTDILKEASLDSVRFYLAMHSPEEETTNFEMDKFKTWTQNIFMPATKIIQSACEGAAGIFQQKEALSEPDAQKACQVIEQWNKYASIEFFSIRKMAALLSGLLEYICQKSQDDTTGLQQLGQLYLLLALPLHPHFSEKILKRTGENIDNAFKRMQNNFITAQV
jgi:methionyl-tRNA synthetase